MNKKPWGILVPLKIQKIIYPKDKAEYERPYILSTISRRISVILSYYILNRTNISPNFVTFFSLIILFFCLIFFINSNYLIGSALACFWNILDNVDGELARLQSFPDDFIFKGTKSSMLVQLGNAVPCGLSNAIAKEIKKLL